MGQRRPPAGGHRGQDACGRFGGRDGVGVGTAAPAAPPPPAPPFHGVRPSGFEVAAAARPRPPRRAEPLSPGRARFVAKRSLLRLIGPRRWGDRSPLICELRRAPPLVRKSAPGAALAAPEPGAPRSCSRRALASPRAPAPRLPRTGALWGPAFASTEKPEAETSAPGIRPLTPEPSLSSQGSQLGLGPLLARRRERCWGASPRASSEPGARG